MIKRNSILGVFFGSLILAGLACATLQPAGEPEPTILPGEQGIDILDETAFGASRQAPYPPGELVPAFTVSVEVADWVRGIEAWEMLYQINTLIDQLPEGREYACVRMVVVNDLPGLSRQISQYGFYLTGDLHVRYPVAGIVTPKPVLGGELRYGEQMHGWNCYLVPVDEENLMLVVDLTGLTRSHGEFLTYIGLTEEVSVTPKDEAYQASSAGRWESAPAIRGEAVHTEMWEIRVLDVIRGEEAFERIIEANQYNRQPPEGMEYLMVYVEAAYFGEGDSLGEIDALAFESFGERGEQYKPPSVVDPGAALDYELYPGGRISGWVVVLAGVDEAGMVLVYKPRGVYDQEAVRYLSLER